MLLIYEDESIYGPGKNGPAMQQIVAIWPSTENSVR
jgi:hypothetical protein